MTQRRRANFFAHQARNHGDIETNNTTAHPRRRAAETDIATAPENCTKNTHFSHAKATGVSVEARPAPAKAMAVSEPGRLVGTAWLRRPWAAVGLGRTTSRRAEPPISVTSPTGVEGAGGYGRAWLRRPWAAVGLGRASRRRTGHHQPTRPHWCEGRRRDRRARAGFEARRRTK